MFVEIGGLINKGLGKGVIKKFHKNKDVITVGVANGRAQDLFDINQFGDSSEAEILTLIVKEKSSNKIFNELYKYLELDKKKQGLIFKLFPLIKGTF
tara:strand:- start:759 stop:1049 length:291 start_codon:yes stop_codon:yes gene_type:complete